MTYFLSPHRWRTKNSVFISQQIKGGGGTIQIKKGCQGRKIVNSLFHCILLGRFLEFKIPTCWCSVTVVLKVWVPTSNGSTDTNFTWELARNASSWASPQIYWGCILANESDVCQNFRITVLQNHSRSLAFILLTRIASKNVGYRDFHGGQVVKTLHFHCREHGFNPWSGN